MASPIEQYIIQKVKEKRLEKGLSQSELAFELNVSNGFVGQIESGKYDKAYNIDHLNELAKILECSPQDFLPKKAL
jgi:transcriptional regulator with XRE-family HTH domain